jgi:hypothetical protein
MKSIVEIAAEDFELDRSIGMISLPENLID